MKKWSLFIILTLLSLNIFSQNCSIFSKANNITPDKLCSPVTASWNVTYTGVNDAGTPVQIMYNWDDGTAVTVSGNTVWHRHFSGDSCPYLYIKRQYLQLSSSGNLSCQRRLMYFFRSGTNSDSLG